MKTLIAYLLLISTAFAAYQEDALNQINALRSKRGLAPYRRSEQLEVAAQMHGDWMARTGQQSHLEGSKPKTEAQWRESTYHPLNRMVRSGYHDFSVLSKPNASHYGSECIASAGPQSGPQRFNAVVIVNGWANSLKGHGKDIYSHDFTDVGIVRVVRKDGAVFWVLVLGRKP